MNDRPTPYADVNAVVAELLARVRTVLGPRFIGLYLDGSLAIGAFDPAKSDLDFLVVTDDHLPEAVVQALHDMHAQLATASAWGPEIEGSYIPRDALRRFDAANAQHPYIDRGSASLAVERHDVDWIVHRHVLREHGVAVVGPELKTLIDPVTPADLRGAVREMLDGWWRPDPACRAKLDHPFYRAYAVLTMCRMRYTLVHGTVVSKPVAAEWAQTTCPRWRSLIDDALAWSRETPPALDATLDFIRSTREEHR